MGNFIWSRRRPPHLAVDVMRATDTGGQEDLFAASGAVSGLTGGSTSLRPGDVESAAGRRTRPTTTGPGSRTSAPTATRTTTTSRTSTGPSCSADASPAGRAGFSYSDLVAAYEDCRRTKRNTDSARTFELNLEANLFGLYEDLVAGTYRPGTSSCFVITRPKFREVWAAPFRDRIVHHLFYNAIHEAVERNFIADSCACIKGRGTLYGALRLEAKARSLTENWRRPAWFLKLDLANFFVSISKPNLAAELERRIRIPWALELALLTLWNDPREGAQYKGPRALAERVPLHKRLGEAPVDRGLPIGNLSSQFFANVLLDVLDKFVKHELRVRHYIRYVDDMVLLADNVPDLERWGAAITAFLPERLGLEINAGKTVLQPVEHGIDFVGQVILPHRRIVRRKTVRGALQRLASMDETAFHKAANSTFGLFRQSSHSHGDRAQLADLFDAEHFA